MMENIHINSVEAFNKGIKEYLGLEKYDKIIKTCGDYNLSDYLNSADYIKLFNGYYKIRYDEEWQKEYYSIFESMKGKAKTNESVCFEEILCNIYSRTKRVEKSFASKMFATIDPDKPIIDSRVENFFALSGIELKDPNTDLKLREYDYSYTDTDMDKLSVVISEYRGLEKWYKDYLKTDDAEELVKRFESSFPSFSHFSRIRKTDYFLWLLG